VKAQHSRNTIYFFVNPKAIL